MAKTKGLGVGGSIAATINRLASGQPKGRKETDSFSLRRTPDQKIPKVSGNPDSGLVDGYGFKAVNDRFDAELDRQSGGSGGDHEQHGAGGGLGRLGKIKAHGG